MVMHYSSHAEDATCGKTTRQANSVLMPYFRPTPAAYISHHEAAVSSLAPGYSADLEWNKVDFALVELVVRVVVVLLSISCICRV